MKRVRVWLRVLPAAILAACAARPAHDAGQGQEPRYVGIGVEALERGVVADEMERLSQRLGEQFGTEIQSRGLRLVRLPGGLILLELSGDAAFDAGSAQLRAPSLQVYARLAQTLIQQDKTVVHVIAHAEGGAGDEAGLSLSERRAASVASYLLELGLPGTRLRYEGRGLREPLAGNATAEGQQRNRRLDLVIRPVIEGREAQAWMPPPYLGG